MLVFSPNPPFCFGGKVSSSKPPFCFASSPPCCFAGKVSSSSSPFCFSTLSLFLFLPLNLPFCFEVSDCAKPGLTE